MLWDLWCHIISSCCNRESSCCFRSALVILSTMLKFLCSSNLSSSFIWLDNLCFLRMILPTFALFYFLRLALRYLSLRTILTAPSSTDGDLDHHFLITSSKLSYGYHRFSKWNDFLWMRCCFPLPWMRGREGYDLTWSKEARKAMRMDRLCASASPL